MRSAFAFYPTTRAGRDMRCFDEMRRHDDTVRPHYARFARWLENQANEAIARKRAEADLLFRRVGITFAVNGDLSGTERLIPFDLIPRIIPRGEWTQLEAGLGQRMQALNLFIHDVYHDRNIVRAGVVPADQVYTNAQY